MTVSPGATLRTLRERKPLVHQITNYVVMNETANATLAIGALPVMAHAPEEVEEMVGLASALVLNIGTLSEHWIEAMLIAGRAASTRRIPVVLDPVGARREIALGHSGPADAAGAMAALDAGIALVRSGAADALVTAPVSTESISRHHLPGFVGHTDYLA